MIKWLLEHGAAPSLFVRNKAGRTPLEVARLFGPFPQTELELQLAEKAEGLRQRVAAARAEREAEVQARGVGRTASMQGASRRAGVYVSRRHLEAVHRSGTVSRHRLPFRERPEVHMSQNHAWY